MVSNAQHLFTELQQFAHEPERLVQFCQDELGSMEKQYFDYKLKSDPRSAKLGDNDKKNLAKAVSGFANTSGGVLIWGVADGATEGKRITDVSDFAARLVSLAGRCVDPPVDSVECQVLCAPGESQGYVVLYIPESQRPPHQVLLNQQEIQGKYFIRAMDNMVYAPHALLEDMFGRRPKPKLSLCSELVPTGLKGSVEEPRYYRLRMDFILKNEGRGYAQAPFLKLVFRRGNQLDGFKFDTQETRLTKLNQPALGMHVYKFSSDLSMVIPPMADFPLLHADFHLQNRPESNEEIDLDYEIYEMHSPSVQGQIKVSRAELVRAARDTKSTP